jgi:hypothetical protein
VDSILSEDWETSKMASGKDDQQQEHFYITNSSTITIRDFNYTTMWE